MQAEMLFPGLPAEIILVLAAALVARIRLYQDPVPQPQTQMDGLRFAKTIVVRYIFGAADSFIGMLPNFWNAEVTIRAKPQKSGVVSLNRSQIPWKFAINAG